MIQRNNKFLTYSVCKCQKIDLFYVSFRGDRLLFISELPLTVHFFSICIICCYKKGLQLDFSMTPAWLLRLCVQVATIAAFCYQMYIGTTKYFGTASISSVDEKNIRAAKLPDIYICPDNDNDSMIKDQEDFLRGNSLNNVVSWVGTNKTYEDMTKEKWQHLDDSLFGSEPEEDLKSLEKTALIAFSGFCSKYVINQTNIPESRMMIPGISYRDNETNFQIFISDSGQMPYYKINPKTLVGDKIEMRYEEERRYFIEFEEVFWPEKLGVCTTYGEKGDFKSYADCVAAEHKEVFKPILGCSVPWLSAPGDPESCKEPIQHGPKWTQMVDGVINAIQMSTIMSQSKTCLKPCLELRAISEIMSTGPPENKGYGRIVLNLKKTVKVTRHEKAYGLFELVVDAGSSLGLWIGLSALGIFDLVADMAAVLNAQRS